MPWLPLYLFGDDFDTLLKILNDDPESAFIVSIGYRQWKAVKNLPAFVENKYEIWHVPSGPLPLPGVNTLDPVGEVIDPWHGWTEQHLLGDPAIPWSLVHRTTTPWFGTGAVGVITLNIRRGDEKTVGMSSLGWIGNHGAVLGISADKVTERWWKRLRATVKRISSKVPRGGPQCDAKPEIFALAGAITAFKEGKSAEVNPGL